MASYNRVILAGNLTRDPQLSYTPNDVAVCKFGMATNRKRRDRDGNMQEEVCYVDLTAFGRGGETINQYMTKGRPILVEGRLHFSRWTNKEGQNRSKLEVVVENFQFLGGAPGAGGGPARGAAGPAAQGPPPPTDDVPPPEEPDIPF